MNVQQLRHLEQAATPAPWSVHEGGRALWISGGLDEPDGAWPIADFEITGARMAKEQPDAELVVAMRNALPHLLDIAEAADEAARSQVVDITHPSAGGSLTCIPVKPFVRLRAALARFEQA